MGARFGFAALAVPLLLSCAPVWATSEECEQEESVALLQVRSATTSECTAGDLVSRDMFLCGKKALTLWGFDASTFEQCLKEKVQGLTISCINCFEQAAHSTFTSCKMECLSGSASCIACGKTFENKCMGTS